MMDDEVKLWVVKEEDYVLNQLFCNHVNHPPTDNHGHSEMFMNYVLTYKKDGGPKHTHSKHRYNWSS